MEGKKLVIMGGGGVGKTSLVLQFLEGFFSPNYRPTLQDCYTHTLQLPNGRFHSLEIVDTSGAHNFPAMRRLCIRSGLAFVVVFAVNDERSFREAKALWSLIVQLKGCQGTPSVLVGNKADLGLEREVSWECGSSFASAAMAPKGLYVETSAKYNLNVGLAFRGLLALAFGHEREREQRRRRSRIRLSFSDISLTSWSRKSSSSSSSSSRERGADDDDDDDDDDAATALRREKCAISYETGKEFDSSGVMS